MWGVVHRQASQFGVGFGGAVAVMDDSVTVIEDLVRFPSAPRVREGEGRRAAAFSFLYPLDYPILPDYTQRGKIKFPTC